MPYEAEIRNKEHDTKTTQMQATIAILTNTKKRDTSLGRQREQHETHQNQSKKSLNSSQAVELRDFVVPTYNTTNKRYTLHFHVCGVICRAGGRECRGTLLLLDCLDWKKQRPES